LFAAEAPTLIGNMAHENPLWGAPWIRELLNLGMQGCRAIHFHVGQLSAEATRPTILSSAAITRAQWRRCWSGCLSDSRYRTYCRRFSLTS